MQDLPIFPTQWKLLPKSDKGVKAQLKVIKTLIPKAQTIVNCGDPDREGQLLVDEILEFYGNKKPVLRFWVSAQDSASIRKGLGNLQPNSKYNGMKLDRFRTPESRLASWNESDPCSYSCSFKP